MKIIYNQMVAKYTLEKNSATTFIFLLLTFFVTIMKRN